MCPKHMLKFLDERMLTEAIAKTVPRAETIILDWKGMGEEKRRIIDMIEKKGLNYERTERII